MTAPAPPNPPSPPSPGPGRSRAVVALGAVVAVLLLAYAGWWGWWLAHGEWPPSVLRWAWKIPCPTTGCARSLAHAMHGDFAGAFLFNPFTLPVIALFLATLAALAVRLFRRQPLRLSNRWLTAWLVVLALAWASKFVLGRTYW